MAFFRNGVCVPLVTYADLLVAAHHEMAVPRDGAIDHLEADDLPRHAGGLLLPQRRRGR